MGTLTDPDGLPLGLAAILAPPQHQVTELLISTGYSGSSWTTHGSHAEYAAQI